MRLSRIGSEAFFTPTNKSLQRSARIPRYGDLYDKISSRFFAKEFRSEILNELSYGKKTLGDDLDSFFGSCEWLYSS